MEQSDTKMESIGNNVKKEQLPKANSSQKKEKTDRLASR
jgi:hypothetical protein